MSNPHLKKVIEWIDLFAAGQLTLTELWQNLGLIPNLLESNVALPVRNAIYDCTSELELIDVTKGDDDRRKLAEALTSTKESYFRTRVRHTVNATWVELPCLRRLRVRHGW